MDKLKPCPFCGGKALLWDICNVVKCTLCGVETITYETEEEAIEVWNRRTDNGEVK